MPTAPRSHEPERQRPTAASATRAPRKPYAPPAIISELRLETRAGSPLNFGPIDPINQSNDYGL